MSSDINSLIRAPGSKDIDIEAPFSYLYDSSTKTTSFFERRDKQWLALDSKSTYSRKWYTVGIAVRPAAFLGYIPGTSQLDEHVAHWGCYICDINTKMCCVVGLNFANQTRSNLILEYAWPTERGWFTGMNIRENELKKLRDDKYRDRRVFCAFPEFILHAQLWLKQHMSNLPRDSEEVKAYRNPEDVSLPGQNYLLLSKNCQPFARYFINRMIEGLWTDPERPRDQNRFISAEEDIARGQKIRHNLQRDAEIFYLEEMAMWIASMYAAYDHFADMQRLVMEGRWRWDLRGAPRRIWETIVECISRVTMWIFMLVAGILERTHKKRE